MNTQKKIQDYKYFKGNIDILDQDIELGEKIIDLLSNYSTNVIIANLIYYGFEGWVLGKVWGGENIKNADVTYYTKRLFGGQRAWHTMLRSRKDGKDWINNDFGGLKKVFTEIKKNGIINFEEDKTTVENYLARKDIKKNSWQYYFIKYNKPFFENDERNIFAWYGTNDYNSELRALTGLKTSLKIEKISTNADRNIKRTSGDKNPFEEFLRAETNYQKDRAEFNITKIKLGNKPERELNESYDIIEEIIKERMN